MTQTGDREIRSVSGRLPDNPGELARMPLVLQQMTHAKFLHLDSRMNLVLLTSSGSETNDRHKTSVTCLKTKFNLV